MGGQPRKFLVEFSLNMHFYKEPQKKDSPEIEEPKKNNNFFRSTYDELKLVVWPNKQQLFSESVAVIIMVSFSAAAIASVSRFYGWAASQIFG